MKQLIVFIFLIVLWNVGKFAVDGELFLFNADYSVGAFVGLVAAWSVALINA